VFAYFYTLLTTLSLIASLPLLPLLMLKKKYRRSLAARFLCYKNSPFTTKSLHFHACSLGEVRALKPLVHHFKKPNLSLITQTGYEAAAQYEADVRYLPFEPHLWWWLRPQKALVVMEAELWYLLFYLSKKRGATTFLVNARISDRSFARYRRFAWFYKKVFENVDYVFAQTEKDKVRLEELGAKNVEVAGNLKLLVRPEVTKRYQKRGFVTVAASTHDPEEEIIATAWVEAGKKGTLVVVPRHPERFDEVDELLRHIAKRENLTYHRLSQRGDLLSDIVLADVMGELVNIYAVSDRVVLGGSFVPNVGGHNPIEAAYFEKPIISGPNFHNQHATYEAVEGIEVVEADELKEALLAQSKPTRIVKSADIDKIIKAIENVV
jgi:3-deoxy-D-manno-octulosonic-acid transferase